MSAAHIQHYATTSAEITCIRAGAEAIGCDDDLGCIELRPACRYENLVQVRCLLEGVSEDDILQHWHTILPESMQRWQLDRQEVQSSAPVVSTALMMTT